MPEAILRMDRVTAGYMGDIDVIRNVSLQVRSGSISERHDSVRLEPCAGDDALGCDRLAGRVQSDVRSRILDAGDVRPEHELSASCHHVVSKRRGNSGKVDDRSMRRVQARDARGMRFQLIQLRASDQLDSRNAVRERPAMELIQGR